MSEPKKIAVAFVCLGNICRSPMAEAVFKQVVKEHGVQSRFSKIDSFGTAGYHIGETPDHRSVQTCKQNGVPVNHRAQQFRGNHFTEFDYVICMDNSNLKNLQNLKKRCGYKDTEGAQIYKFGHWNTKDSDFNSIVEDPYYGGSDGFQYNFKQIKFFSENFLKSEL